jgi:hypothetical protein
LGIELEKPRQQQEKQQLSQSFSILPIKFKTVFQELSNKHASLNCGIEKIDTILKLTSCDRLAVIGNQKYTQTLISRLCINALLLTSPPSSKRIADFFTHLM